LKTQKITQNALAGSARRPGEKGEKNHKRRFFAEKNVFPRKYCVLAALLMAPIAHQPGPGGYQGTSTSQLVGSVVLGCTATPAVPPARDLDFFISTGVLAVFGPWASGPGPEAHAGIAFYAPDFGCSKRQKVKIR
jgi:hypothetical protein